MLEKTTPFVPGFGHAGVSTHPAVKKRLYKSSGKTWSDLGCEEFLKKVTLGWGSSAAHRTHIRGSLTNFSCLTAKYQTRITHQ